VNCHSKNCEQLCLLAAQYKEHASSMTHTLSSPMRKSAVTITSHALCPSLHAWQIALELTNAQRDVEYRVERFTYPTMSTWAERTPPGAALPFLTTARNEVLTGPLPVLHYLLEVETTPASLPADRVERVRVRNRAMMAADIATHLRPVLIARTEEAEREALTQLFTLLHKADAQPWSPLPLLDAIVLAAAATVAASQARLMRDPRWRDVPRIEAHMRTLSADPMVQRTRAKQYAQHFGEFFRAFGSAFDRIDAG
jgi:glutathione S-transferase